MRKSIFSASVLFISLSLGAGFALADASVKTPTKGRPGAACKSNTDCDQSEQTQTCTNKKCQVFRVPPPT